MKRRLGHLEDKTALCFPKQRACSQGGYSFRKTHESCDTAKVIRCPAEQWAFTADTLWERGTFFSHSQVFSSILMERRGKERNLLCSAISCLSTGFERASVCQWKIPSIYLGWQHGLSAVVVSLSRCFGKRGPCCWRSAAEEAGKARTRVLGRIPERFSRDWGKSVSG